MAEPAGRTYSARLIIYVAADEEEPVVRVYRLPKPVVGVSMVASYVKQAHPNYDWEQLRIEEPIPVVIDGRIYWKVTITTRDHRGLVAVDIVDAETTTVYTLQPRRHISYLDALEAITRLLKSGAIAGERPSLAERIEKLEERIKAIQEELNKVLEELEQLKKLVSNTTRG